MKQLWLALLLTLSLSSYAQQPSENIIIITTDGFRWQELFRGADSAIFFNDKYVTDTASLGSLYWAATPEERRKKLMPFTWNYIAAKGQLWGNREWGNKVSVANPYRFSYAGYNEIFTGYADPSIMTNKARNNSNRNLLAYLNSLEEYRNSVVSFGSWKLFSHILNGTSQKIPLNCGYQPAAGDSLTFTEQAVNYLQSNSEDAALPTRTDLLTFTMATEYIRKNHPRIVHIGFGETDEFAHHSQYDNYLNQANQFDKFLSDLWTLLQRDPFYRNKTTLFITTDHGRGRKPGNWAVHGPFTGGSDETWLMQLGPNIAPLGEVRFEAEVFNEEFAQTIARYLGKYFTASHPVAGPSYAVLQSK